ncbi:MAG: cysteine desulfurase [Oscillospiraceae bacterium]|jgi:cysteine desulfurase|nr:cysteine desulfurase [Oscillospiraceae bacterium]
MSKNIYLDNAASTKVCEEATEAMLRVMKESFGNPSSMHEYGRRAKSELETARKNVADALGAKPENIYFTSGGTEANNWAILGTAEALSRKGKHIITTAIEHSAVTEPIKKLENQGWEVTYLMPDNTGRIPTEAFTKALRQDTVFASIMLVNNDTGAVNNISEYKSEIKRCRLNTLLHTDAVQGMCKIPFSVKTLEADLIAVSSHKLHGPKGIGALYVKDGIKLAPLILGGSHEKGIRGGTEPLPAAVGFGEAAKLGNLKIKDNMAKVRETREYTVKLLKTKLPEIVFIGEGDSPYLLCISLPGYKGEVLMNYLDNEGIYVSRSAACKKGARSRTLEAMRLKNEIIDSALRVSFSRYNTKEEAEHFVKVLKTASQTLYKSL